MERLLRAHRVARQCAVEQVDYQPYLLRITELELLERERRATERRICQAKFPVVKTMELRLPGHSVAEQNPGIGTGTMRVPRPPRERPAVGQQWHGKTHIALALGLAACQRGHRVRFTTTAALVSERIEARNEKKLLRFQKQIASYELLIVDELGLRASVQDRRRTVVRDAKPALGTWFNAGHFQPSVPRVDRNPRLGALDRRPARSAHTSCKYPGEERRYPHPYPQKRLAVLAPSRTSQTKLFVPEQLVKL